ncbi:MAG: hypothetical protein ACOVNL_04790 [Prochlorococcaceae cyanobacterium]|jgi:hypothetical protein
MAVPSPIPVRPRGGPCSLSHPAGILLALLGLGGAVFLPHAPAAAQVIPPDPSGTCPAGFQAIGGACVNPNSAPGWTYPNPSGQDCLPEWMYIPEQGECLRN